MQCSKGDADQRLKNNLSHKVCFAHSIHSKLLPNVWMYEYAH